MNGPGATYIIIHKKLAAGDRRGDGMATITEEVSANVDEQPSKVLIDVRNLVKRFPVGDGEVTVLSDLSFQINHGEFVSIVGPSGSGKSTLINMFTGIDHPSEGEVEVGGVRLNDMSEGELARWRGQNLGLVFQFYQLLPALSVVDNVILPMDFANKYDRKERRERAMGLLDTVGLAQHALKLPSMISGGEQQRVAIARAMANDPPLIVGDEPTGNLDSASSERMVEMFFQLVQEGKTLIMVTHDRDLAHRTPRMIEIADGRIVRDGDSRSITL